MTRRTHRAARAARWPTLLLAVAALLWVPSPAAAASDPGPAAQQLIDRYVPIVRVRRYDPPCSSTGEPFVPMTVDPVLGNPEVALRQVGNGDAVIRWAPTARDLYGAGEGVYLDFAGDSLRPGCTYATDSARYAPPDSSAVYAHVAAQADRPGYLAVQYWLYWYYNDWNNRHESDWEFVQVLFRASSVDEALTREPTGVGYAQHEGGQVSAWASGPLRREGSHPVVYSSERSHASYFEPALYLGRGASEGFGCDDTQGPSTELRPRAVLLPDAPSGPDDPLAWLAFSGRWGERHGGANNGPTGPSTKPRWSEPLTWQDDLRESSFVIPGGSEAPSPIVGAFCTVVGAGSVVYVGFVANPGAVLAVLALLALLLAFLLHRTSWRRVAPLPIVARRRIGEIVRASTALYRTRPATFATIGLVAIPVAALAVLVSFLLQHLPVVGEPATVTSDASRGRLSVAATVAAAFWPLTLLLASGTVAALLHRSDDSAVGAATGQPNARAALRAVRGRARDLASAFVPAAVVVGLLAITVVGAPVALWLGVRFTFVAQTVMVEGLGGRRALGRSSRLVRHRWWHTAVIGALVWAVVNVVALLVGLVLLVTVTGLPLWVVTLAAVVVQIALVPLGGIVLTLLYGDARAERDPVEGTTDEPEPALTDA